MYHLKLIKGKSYWGIVKATEEKPDVYVREKEQADRLVASGHFILVNQEEAEAEAAEPDMAMEEYAETEEAESTSEIVSLQKKTKDALIAYAGLKGIDITGCTKKDEILQKILQEIARASAARDALRN